jgi:hypothetical protein
MFDARRLGAASALIFRHLGSDIPQVSQVSGSQIGL